MPCTRFLIGAMALLTFVSAAPVVLAEPPVRTIKVTGGSGISVVPDEVILSLKVVTENKDLLAAKSDNDARTRAVLALAEKYHVEPKHVQIEEMRLDPRYDRAESKGEQKLIGYSFARGIEITLHDFEILEPLLSDVLKAGANRVESILFRTTKHRQQQFAAREMAVEIAKEKAGHLAELNGLMLGKAIAIEEGLEGNVHTPFMACVAADVGLDDGGGLPGRLISYRQAPGKPAAQRRKTPAERQPIAPGQIMITADVTITFELLERR